MDDKYMDLMASEMEAAGMKNLSLPLARNSSENCRDNERAILATARATTMFGCYRKDEANDPKVYLTAVVGILVQYPETIIEKVTDPVNGLPSQSVFLPALAEIKQACDILAEKEARYARYENWGKNLGTDQEKDTAPKVDLNKYKDQYGNWLHSDKESSIPSNMKKRVYTEAEKKAFLDDAIATGFEFSISQPKLLPETLKAMKEKDDFEEKFT